MIAVSITTCPRRDDIDQELLFRCVSSLVEAGFTTFHIQCEPSNRIGDLTHVTSLLQQNRCNYTIGRNATRLGPWPNFTASALATLKLGLRHNKNYYLLSQDDVVYPKDFYRWLVNEICWVGNIEHFTKGTLLDHPLCYPSITSFWLPSRYDTGMAKWWQNPIDGDFRLPTGALSYFSQRNTLLQLCNDPYLPKGRTGLERHLLHWCRNNHIPYWNPPFNIVQNIGEGHSTLDAPQSQNDPLGFRYAKTWIDDVTNIPFPRETA